MSLSRPQTELFSKRLREMRERRGYSQDELAQRSGLQPSAVSHFETGKRKPSFDNLRRLADALEVTTDFLLGRVEEPTGLAGPAQLFRDYEKLTEDDRRVVSSVVRELAKKGEEDE